MNDLEITTNYYNLNFDYVGNLAFEIDVYHNCNIVIASEELENFDNNHYLCFVTLNNGKEALDGTYKTLYIGDL